MRALRVAILSALLGLVSSQAAWAQNERSWVASFGSDSNACTRAMPCASFAFALTKTNAGGEINCIDQGDFSGGFGLVIGKSVTIDCEGVPARYGIALSQGPAIDVNAS
ncbi:MAG: hypothetical protein JO366_19605, partial [Methylobacteriaceae bacterium]|nr:hypothetical protein [Methylobacteriaceae bacterium]